MSSGMAAVRAVAAGPKVRAESCEVTWSLHEALPWQGSKGIQRAAQAGPVGAALGTVTHRQTVRSGLMETT